MGKLLRRDKHSFDTVTSISIRVNYQMIAASQSHFGIVHIDISYIIEQIAQHLLLINSRQKEFQQCNAI